MEELGNLIQVVTDGRILGNQFLKFGKFGSDIVVDLEDFESRYQAEIEELEAEFKNIMMKVSVIEKAFSYVNPWLTKFQDLTTPEILERTHIKKYVERVWIDDFKRVEVVLKEEEWTRFFPEEWMRTRKEN